MKSNRKVMVSESSEKEVVLKVQCDPAIGIPRMCSTGPLMPTRECRNCSTRSPTSTSQCKLTTASQGCKGQFHKLLTITRSCPTPLKILTQSVRTTLDLSKMKAETSRKVRKLGVATCMWLETTRMEQEWAMTKVTPCAPSSSTMLSKISR